MSQIASIGDVNTCTFLTNLATTGPAVYAFNCAGRINTNAFANQPVDAVRAWQQLQSLSSEALSPSQLALGLTSRKGTPTTPGKAGSVTVLQVPASLRFSELPTVDRCERAPRTMCGHPAPCRRWPLITPSASPRSRSPREHSPYPARLWRPAPVLAPPVQQPLRARIHQASAADAERSRSTAASPTDAFLMPDHFQERQVPLLVPFAADFGTYRTQCLSGSTAVDAVLWGMQLRTRSGSTLPYGLAAKAAGHPAVPRDVKQRSIWLNLEQSLTPVKCVVCF